MSETLSPNMRRLRSFVFEQKCIPWSVSSRYERWMETQACYRWPALYRLLRFGDWTDRVRAATQGPAHHFYGYYDKSPWNASGNLMLAHEVAFNDRAPTPQDVARIGVVHLDDGYHFEPLAESLAWNWQQGAMLQWHKTTGERCFFYNRRRGDQALGVLYDVEKGPIAEFERPIYALCPGGKTAFSLNFGRLHRWRPGYGYAGVREPFTEQEAPEDDGLHIIDLGSGTSSLLISLQQLAELEPRPDMEDTTHWLNHIQVSPGGKRVAFFHIWRYGADDWRVRLYAVRPEGTDLIRILDTGSISHYDWRDDDQLLVWARHLDGSTAFLSCDLVSGAIEVFGHEILNEDGHCSFSPDRRWVLNDTYPDRYDRRTLMLVSEDGRRRIDIGRFHSPKAQWWGEIRCDLHPRWNRDGTQVCIDSVHSGERQMYILDVADIV